jgi:tetratricopeptide (TPR) repeat protein
MFSRRQLLAGTFAAGLIFLSSQTHDARAMSFQSSSPDSSQANEREQGIKLYEKGKTAEAIQALQGFVKGHKNDIRTWHYLGLALSRNGRKNQASKAHEKAAKLGSQLIRNQPKGLASTSEVFARFIPSIRELTEAADSADKYLGLSLKPSAEKVWDWRERAALLRGYAEISDEMRVTRIFTTKGVTTKARIIDKPSPEYTEEARKNQVTGTVTLLLVVSADGKVLGTIPTAELPFGLTEMAIEAARKIVFTPATIDGKPVSQFIRVEYNFNIY